MPYLFGALWVLIIFGFMAAFFPYSSGLELGYGIAAALIFSAYILVDTQVSFVRTQDETYKCANEYCSSS
jgi:hypothetical protein